MTTDSFIASTTQFQTLLIALVLIVAVIYFFIELRRIDNRISNLEVSVKKIFTDKETQLVAVKEVQLSPDQGFSVINPAVDQSIMEPTEEVITNDITPLLTEVERSDDTKVTDVIVDVADVEDVEDVVDVVDVVEDVEDIVDVVDVEEDVVDVEDVEDIVDDAVVDDDVVDDVVDDDVVNDDVVNDALLVINFIVIERCRPILNSGISTSSF